VFLGDVELTGLKDKVLTQLRRDRIGSCSWRTGGSWTSCASRPRTWCLSGWSCSIVASSNRGP